MFQRKTMTVMSATQVGVRPKSIARFTWLLRCLVLALAGSEVRISRIGLVGTVPTHQPSRSSLPRVRYSDP